MIRAINYYRKSHTGACGLHLPTPSDAREFDCHLQANGWTKRRNCFARTFATPSRWWRPQQTAASRRIRSQSSRNTCAARCHSSRASDRCPFPGFGCRRQNEKDMLPYRITQAAPQLVQELAAVLDAPDIKEPPPQTLFDPIFASVRWLVTGSEKLKSVHCR